MILRCNFEELRALASAGEAVVAAAAPETGAKVDVLLPRLTGDVSIDTLDDQRGVRQAVSAIVDDLRERMDRDIIAQGPASEDAVNLYFDYGYSRSVLHRLDEMGSEMEALADLITGGHPELAGAIHFPD
jgi:hypothetical protein